MGGPAQYPPTQPSFDGELSHDLTASFVGLSDTRDQMPKEKYRAPLQFGILPPPHWIYLVLVRRIQVDPVASLFSCWRSPRLPRRHTNTLGPSCNHIVCSRKNRRGCRSKNRWDCTRQLDRLLTCITRGRKSFQEIHGKERIRGTRTWLSNNLLYNNVEAQNVKKIRTFLATSSASEN